VAETEKHGFSHPARQQRQQENDSIASTPTVSSDPPLPTGSITKKSKGAGVLPGSQDSILPSEATDVVVRDVPKPNVRGLLELKGRATEGKRESPKGWGESCNDHHQQYLVKKNERRQQSREKETTEVRNTGDKRESGQRSSKVCRCDDAEGPRESTDARKSVVSPRKGGENVRYGVLCPCCDLNKETSGPKHGKGWG